MRNPHRTGACMYLPNPSQARRLRLILVIGALIAAAIAMLFAPGLALVLLLVTALLIIWDRRVLERDLRRLAAGVASTATEAKLEVTDDAWGELCHAVNRLRQQRRAEQQRQRLLPELPAVEELLEADLPPEGLPCDVAALAIAPPEGWAQTMRLHEVAALAAASMREYDALLTRPGKHLVMIFGLTGRQGPAAMLRNALQTARAMHARWPRDATRRPRLALSSGQVRVIALPGLGLTVIGPPVDQALVLLDLADEDLLLCNEETYLTLRHLGQVPAPHASQRRVTGEGYPDAYAIPL
ncbi:MAG: hypothetical protein ACUVS4_05730 [Chloroflexaceae bacterium]